jgi:hypothetical protein
MYRQIYEQGGDDKVKVESRNNRKQEHCLYLKTKTLILRFITIYLQKGWCFRCNWWKDAVLRGAEYIIQQDGAKPHTANGTIKELDCW